MKVYQFYSFFKLNKRIIIWEFFKGPYVKEGFKTIANLKDGKNLEIRTVLKQS